VKCRGNPYQETKTEFAQKHGPDMRISKFKIPDIQQAGILKCHENL
jgi:hypothetical protein